MRHGGRLAAHFATLARGDVAGAVAPLANMLGQFVEFLVGELAKPWMVRGLDERDLIRVEHTSFMPSAATHVSLPSQMRFRMPLCGAAAALARAPL